MVWGSILAIEPVCFLRPGVELAEHCVLTTNSSRAPGSAEKLGAHDKDFFCLSRAPSMETHFAVLGERCKSTNTTPGADRGCEDRVQVDGQAAYVLVSSGGGASSKSWEKENNPWCRKPQTATTSRCQKATQEEYKVTQDSWVAPRDDAIRPLRNVREI